MPSTDFSFDIIPELLLLRSELTPDALAYHYQSADGNWTAQTWANYRDEVSRLAAAWHAEGLRAGDRMAIMLPTGRQWEAAQQAALVNGATVVGIEAGAPLEEIGRVLDHAEVTWLILPAAMASRIPISRYQRLTRAIVVGEQPAVAGPNMLNWSQCVAVPSPGGSMQGLIAERNPDEVATIIFTSGTTGKPKGVAVTHRQMMVACRAIVQAQPELGDQDRTICWLPMAALFQRVANLVAMAHGMQTWFVEDPRRILESLEEIGPSYMIGVPRFFEKLHETLRQTGNADAADWRQRIKYMVTGSAPLPRTILQDLHRQGLLVLEAYGVTENTVPIAMNRAAAFRFGSVGKPLPQNEVRLESDGEVLVRGPGVFRGYLQEPPAAGLFTADGFYRTGDCGYLDQDGFLYLTGRKAEIIKTSTGRRISPLNVEAVYQQSPYLEQAVVFGDGRKYLAALLTLNEAQVERYLAQAGVHTPAHKPQSTEMIKELILAEIKRLEVQLAPHERIQAAGVLATSLSAAQGEMTATGKLRRAVIGANHQQLLQQLYRTSPPCVLIAGKPPLLPDGGLP